VTPPGNHYELAKNCRHYMGSQTHYICRNTINIIAPEHENAAQYKRNSKKLLGDNGIHQHDTCVACKLQADTPLVVVIIVIIMMVMATIGAVICCIAELLEQLEQRRHRTNAEGNNTPRRWSKQGTEVPEEPLDNREEAVINGDQDQGRPQENV
jgi:hypothetical protein